MADQSVIKTIKEQQTFCLIKPDGVMRGLVGEIIHRVEKTGLKIVAMKMLVPTEQQIKAHYPMEDQDWVERLGHKSLGTFADLKMDPEEHLGSSEPKKVGQTVADSLVGYLTSGPVVCFVVEGVQAIDMVRKLAGHTLPVKAEVGTIRGDFSVDSPAIANLQMRPVHNVLHASETPEEAANEVSQWFKPDEIHSYSRSGEATMFSKTY